MKKLFYIVSFFILTQHLVAQTFNDITRIALDEFTGSARYSGMAGAFVAVGGDLTAVNDNPASSSIFLHSEVGVGLNFASLQTDANYSGTSTLSNNRNLNFNQVGGVFVFNNTQEESSWSKISFGFNYQCEADYKQDIAVSGNSNRGIDNYFLYYADGLRFDNLPLYENETIGEVYQILGEEIGFGAQQAFLGYQAYLINPLTNDDANTSYVSNVSYSNVAQDISNTTEGQKRRYTFNVGGVYQEKLHLGFNFNAYQFDFSQRHELEEYNHDADSFASDINFTNDLISYGAGVSVQFGAILKLKNFRLGASYHSPLWLTFEDETQQSISAYHVENDLFVNETINPLIDNFPVTNVYPEYNYKIPSKLNAGLALLLGNCGLLSVDVSSQNFSNLRLSQKGGSDYLESLNEKIAANFQTVNTVKIGGEFRVENVSLRAGYFSKSALQKAITSLDGGFTLGLGLDFGSSALNVAYVNFNRNSSNNVFDQGLSNSYRLTDTFNNVVLTYNLKL